MNAERVRAVLARLRCIECKRAPAAEEVDEMLSNFGHKLTPGEDERALVWRCRPCMLLRS
jgi:hypothetical protein